MRTPIQYWFDLFETCPAMRFSDLAPHAGDSIPPALIDALRLYCAGLPRPA